MWSPQGNVRIFTLEEANSLVPQLSDLVGAQLELAETIQERVGELSSEVGTESSGEAELVDITVYPTDLPDVRELKRDLADLIRRYRAGWRAVQEMGAVVKDTSTGLIDFYGKVDDRLVWLCWRYGESSVDYYHELDAGFSGRKPLASVRKRMLN